MSTVTIAQYRTQTGDSTTASATVQEHLDTAEGLVEDFLRRDLASAERAETMKLWPGNQVFPKHTPVTSVPASASYEVYDSARVQYVDADLITTDVGRWPVDLDDAYPHSLPQATITYTGGWTSDTLPTTIVRIVAKVAQRFVTAASIPDPGVAQASVGDVSVTYSQAAGEAETVLDSLFPLSTAMLKPYRWRPR